ncbi:hypothetical protein [Burkholderia sp. Ac-20365]|uniref:hypothetical protein n=1 Tax=Burkholderia sp. Ac-20365 TaxID=2703897 RepID=UPI00197BD957|nr:hypothetical protein [Burkholderia sp. Ac-20365]MBN3761255.1 hypothetical protein [Burkholderia sp. Ac-20365]
MADNALIEEIQNYAASRKNDVSRGAETAAFAALMVEKYGEGLAKAAHLLGADNGALMREVRRLVLEIDPQYPKHRQFRFEARPIALAIDGRVI